MPTRQVPANARRLLLYALGAKILADAFVGLTFPLDSHANTWAIYSLAFVVLPSVLLAILWYWGGVAPSTYALTHVVSHENRLEFWPAFITYTILLASVYAAGYLAGLFVDRGLGFLTPRIVYGELLGRPASPFLAAYVALSSAAFKEIFYRGLFQLAFESAFASAHRLVMVGTSAIAFSLTHWPLGIPVVLGSFLYGTVAAWLYFRQGDLRPLVAGHALLVFVALVA